MIDYRKERERELAKYEGGEFMKEQEETGTSENALSQEGEPRGTGEEHLPDFIRNDPEWMEIFHASRGIAREAPSGTMGVKIIMRDDYPDEKKKK
jgi:hypothetical protein